MTDNQIKRAKKLIEDIIRRTGLDLSGMTVLTEVGSNFYAFTPIIAALAGAKKVYAWTSDTGYGKGKDVVEKCHFLCKQMGVDSTIAFSINERPVAHIRNSDIVTNLGFVRPIDKQFIDNMAVDAVIAYMCEAWEVREGDVDIDYAKKKGIKVGGTWENHPDLGIFDGCGYLMAKLCFEAGFEIYQNKILIVSEDHFGEVAHATLKKFAPQKLEKKGIDEVRNLSSKEEYDVVILADYTAAEILVGDKGVLPLVFLRETGIVHLCGMVDKKYCDRHGIGLYPDKDGERHRMTETLAYLGMKPVIDLHAAGLKVGEALYRNSKNDMVQYM